MAARILIGLVGFLGLAAAAAGETVLLVDRSGSMKPYYASGIVRRLGTTIVEASASVDRPTVVAFNTATETLAGVDQLSGVIPSGNTLLADALGRHVHSDRIWIVTDNVQDVGGASEAKHDMSSFYAILRADRVRWIYVFPLRQRPGTAGLLVYAIGTADHEPLRRQVTRFRELTRDLAVDEILMKPLGENAIAVETVSENPVLNFKEGDTLVISQQVTIGPKFPHLYFESSPAAGGKVQTPFRANSCLVPEKAASSITPSLVHTASADTYHVKVDFGRVQLKRTPDCIVQAAFGRASESEEIATPIEIVVPQQNLRLSQAFLDEYSADTPAEATATGRIFGIRNVPGFVAPRDVLVPINLPRRVNVAYPSWPALLLVGLTIAGLAGGATGGPRAVRWARARLARPGPDAAPTPAASSAARPGAPAPPPPQPKREPLRR